MLWEILILPIPGGDIKQCVRGGQGVLRIAQARVTRNSQVKPCWKSKQVKTDISLECRNMYTLIILCQTQNVWAACYPDSVGVGAYRMSRLLFGSNISSAVDSIDGRLMECFCSFHKEKKHFLPVT